MTSQRTHLLASAFAILIAGACTTAMNWRFSYQLGTTAWDSYTWAIFSVALDVTKWLMLPFAALAWSDHKLVPCGGRDLACRHHLLVHGRDRIRCAQPGDNNCGAPGTSQICNKTLETHEAKPAMAIVCSMRRRDHTAVKTILRELRRGRGEAQAGATSRTRSTIGSLRSHDGSARPRTVRLSSPSFLRSRARSSRRSGFSRSALVTKVAIPDQATGELEATERGPALAPQKANGAGLRDRVATWRDMTGRDTSRQRDMRKAPGSYSGGCSFSGGVAVVVRWAERGDPGFYRRAIPRHPASTELYPPRELPGLLEPRDMLCE